MALYVLDSMVLRNRLMSILIVTWRDKSFFEVFWSFFSSRKSR